MIFKPAFANRTINIRSEDIAGGATIFVAVSNACEVVAVKMIAGSGAAVARLYDANSVGNANPSVMKVPMAAEASNSDDFCPAQPMGFKNGVVVSFEQGDPGNAEICLVLND
jgi:hypothetical protein